MFSNVFGSKKFSLPESQNVTSEFLDHQIADPTTIDSSASYDFNAVLSRPTRRHPKVLPHSKSRALKAVFSVNQKRRKKFISQSALGSPVEPARERPHSLKERYISKRAAQ